MLVLRPLPFSSPTSPTPLAAPQDMYCFTGKKTSGNKMAGGSNYVISLDQDETKKSKSADTAIGKIKADRKSIDDLFNRFDPSGDGEISFKELSSLIRSVSRQFRGSPSPTSSKKLPKRGMSVTLPERLTELSQTD